MANMSGFKHSQFEALVETAVKAPSSHNTQPWLFRICSDGVDVIADRTRALPANDPHDRELTISCGAALFNLRVAAAEQELAVKLELTPKPENPDLLVRLQIQPGTADTRLARFSPATTARHTTRKAFSDTGLPDGLLNELTDTAHSEGAKLVPLEGESRSRVAALVAEGDRHQFDNAAWRRELASWMRTRRKGDGITTAAVMAPLSKFVVSHFDLGESVARQDKELALTAPLFAVLCTEKDNVRHWLAAGQALERILLIAADRGVQAGFLNQPCQVESLRPRLAEILGNGSVPQLILRLGFPADSPGKSARRPLAEVLMGAGIQRPL